MPLGFWLELHKPITEFGKTLYPLNIQSSHSGKCLTSCQYSNILYIGVGLLYLSIKFYCFLDKGPTHLLTLVTVLIITGSEMELLPTGETVLLVWGHDPDGSLGSEVTLDLKSGSRRKRRTFGGWFIFIAWRRWTSQKCSKG